MNLTSLHHAQRGATLIVSLIMLAVITLLVTTAFTLSNTNLKAVSNMQFRDQATAAANVAIEATVTGFINAAPTAQTVPVDLNNDGTNEYAVSINPTCIKTSVVGDGDGLGLKGSEELGPGLSVGAGSIAGYITMWNIDATVTDTATGARVRVHQGVRKLLSSLPSSCA